uniref:NADH dehydrogenase [ubiquinone] 1 alpha subcomplex subunit 11 n=1 Tax=Leptobrachium leishanense TaxID=445787 RepID=A0A8C5LHB7_9ANUR
MGYWDIEEGTECFQKTWITTKLGAMIGLVGSAYHIVAFQPKTALEGVQRATMGTLTMASLGAIFGVTTCLSAQIRDKPEDPWNFFAGGCASGIFLGVKSVDTILSNIIELDINGHIYLFIYKGFYQEGYIEISLVFNSQLHDWDYCLSSLWNNCSSDEDRDKGRLAIIPTGAKSLTVFFSGSEP